MPKREKLTYVLCINDPREYDKLAKLARAKHGEDAIVAQAIPVGRLQDDCEMVCAFYVGNGNIKDKQTGQQVEREPVFTAPVPVSKHWTKGSRGTLGKIRLADFLTEASSETASQNANIRHYNDELTLGYG